MKNFLRDNEVQAVEVVEFLTPILKEVYESHAKFLETYVHGAILYIPTGYSTRLLGKIFLRYDVKGLYVCSERNMDDAVIGFRYTNPEDKSWSWNEISVHDNRFTLYQHDKGCIVRIDSDSKSSPKQEMTVAIEDDICYHSGKEHGGVEETVFLYSMDHETRPIEHILRELAAASAAIEELPIGTEFYCDATDFADYVFYPNFITGNLI